MTRHSNRDWVRRRESGAVLVETALVTVLLCILSFGVIEYGLLLRQSNQVADGVRSGIRAASVTATNSTADFDIVSAMKDSSTSLAGDVERLVIYKADANGNPVGACNNFVVVPGQCNVYTQAEFNRNRAYFETRASGQGGWSPGSRQPGVDYIGIKVDTNHRFITAFFQNVINLNDRAVVRLETPPLEGSEANVDTGWGNGTNVSPGPQPRVAVNECAGCTGSSAPPGGQF